MSLSMLSPSRTVLLVSDDALYIYSQSAKGVAHIETVPWSAEGFVDDVALILSKDCGGKPILIINDMVEQHYRKERVPRVSVMDRQNVVKRKLQVAFNNYPVRAALPLKEKVKKAKGQISSDIYLFAAVPATEVFAKTMAAATKSLAPIAGFCLLPVESSDFIKKASDKLRPKNKKKPQWTVFMAQHKTGSLRQIVVKNGDLALTRMTPVSNFESNAQLWVKDVKQEFQATMSYLSRFGFDPSDGLEIIIVADSSLSPEDFEGIVEIEADIYVHNIQDLASKVGLRLGRVGTTYFADFLHVGWIGRKNSFVLPMRAQQLDRVSKPRQIAALLSFGLILGIGYVVYDLYNSYTSLVQKIEDINRAEQNYQQVDLQYKVELERKAEMGFDIMLIQSSLEIFDLFEKQRIDYLTLFYRIGVALGRDMRIDRIAIERGEVPDPKASRNSKRVYPQYIAEMQMTFPSSTDAEKGNEEVDNLRNRLQESMPDYKLTVSKYLEDYEYSQELVVETGTAGAKSAKQDYVAEIIIEGPPQ